MKCPSCSRRLKLESKDCICGWGKFKEKITDCFFAPQCTRPARLRTDQYTTKGNFQALCFECVDKLHSEHAEKWCAEQGLHTREHRIAYCLKVAGSNRVLKPIIDKLVEKNDRS